MITDDDGRPHLFKGEDDLFREELARATSYLEFGTGGSTLRAATSGVRRIVSVDSDQTWVRKISDRIAAERSTVDIELIHCDIGRTGEWGMPTDYGQVANWPQYFVQPWGRFLTANDTPDLIFVDGRFRVACVLYSLLNLCIRRPTKAARIMIHDFSYRPFYGRILEHASIVATANSLVVVRERPDISLPRLLNDLLSFQFDAR